MALELSLAAFSAAFLLVVLAEMGDKTQFVAMSFAAKYNPYKVLFAVFLGTVANFAIVIAIGEALSAVVPLDAVSLAASFAFIGFGLWGLREEKEEEEKTTTSRFGVVATVGVTFFIAELGDKTQLATLSLSVQYQDPIGVLIGATLAMLVADGLGIIIGVVFCKRIPRRVFKRVSTVLFVAFGLLGVYEVLPLYAGLTVTVLILLLLGAFSVVSAYMLSRKQKTHETPNVCKQKAD